MRSSRRGEPAGSLPDGTVLVLNCGSSSIKYSLFEGVSGRLAHHGLVDRVTDYDEALEAAFGKIEAHGPGGLPAIRAVGHRVVHGGRRFGSPHLVNREVLDAIRAYAELAPLHNPPNIRGIEFASAMLPDVPQVAVFDTSFHSTIPPEAHNYAIPMEIARKHRIRRYGFHGISHHFVHDRALEMTGHGSADGMTVITCHLGNGCSISAIREGRCVDTSMGFTPLEGLVMGTRCGDLDPAVVHYLGSPKGGGMTSDQIHTLLNRESGLKGLSGLSSDVRDLLRARAEGHEGARLALSVFTYRLRKYIAAYHGVLRGVRILVFTAGIGENSPQVRAEALMGLEPLGFVIDQEANSAALGVEADITGKGSAVRILVVPTDEDRMIYLETARLIGLPGL